jgi:hypothetical protein
VFNHSLIGALLHSTPRFKTKHSSTGTSKTTVILSDQPILLRFSSPISRHQLTELLTEYSGRPPLPGPLILLSIIWQFYRSIRRLIAKSTPGDNYDATIAAFEASNTEKFLLKVRASS